MEGYELSERGVREIQNKIFGAGQSYRGQYDSIDPIPAGIPPSDNTSICSTCNTNIIIVRMLRSIPRDSKVNNQE